MSTVHRCAMALTTAVLFTVLASAAHAQTTPSITQLRFFTSPAERQRLDALRQGASRPKRTPRKEAPVERTPPPSPPVVVQGVVVRSNGPDVVWVNDENTLRDDRITGGMRAQTGDAGMANIDIPNRGSIKLRPGQSYDPATGKTTGIHVNRRP